MDIPDKQQLIKIVEESEISLWQGIWQAVSPATSNSFAMEYINDPRYLAIMMKKVPAWFFNRVLGLGLQQQATGQMLDELTAYYQAHKLSFAISLSPLAQPKDLATQLAQRGFTEANRWAKMYRPATPAKAIKTDLRIEQATPAQAGIFAEIIVKGFGVDPAMKPVFAEGMLAAQNRAYLAWDGDHPVAAGMLTLAGEVGHLNTAATLPEARGRGAQGAIMAKRIEDSIAAGCRWIATETWLPARGETNHSYNNMLRHGFIKAYERPNLVLEPS